MTTITMSVEQLTSVTKDAGSFWASAWSAAGDAYTKAVKVEAQSGILSA